MGVFSCGPGPLTNSISDACETVNRQRKLPYFIHHYENFGWELPFQLYSLIVITDWKISEILVWYVIDIEDKKNLYFDTNPQEKQTDNFIIVIQCESSEKRWKSRVNFLYVKKSSWKKNKDEIFWVICFCMYCKSVISFDENLILTFVFQSPWKWQELIDLWRHLLGHHHLKSLALNF